LTPHQSTALAYPFSGGRLNHLRRLRHCGDGATLTTILAIDG
jgi:hypothetical protein